jgi:hypothetical protein
MSKCRITLTFNAEFELSDPDVELAQLLEQAEFDPRGFIYTAYGRRYTVDTNVNIERDI